MTENDIIDRILKQREQNRKDGPPPNRGEPKRDRRMGKS